MPVLADTGCSLEDIPEVMDDRDGWKKRVEKLMLSAQLDDIYIYWSWDSVDTKSTALGDYNFIVYVIQVVDTTLYNGRNGKSNLTCGAFWEN